MGKIKTLIFVAAGILLIAVMMPNALNMELSPAGACIIVVGIITVLLPFAAKKLNRRFYHRMSVFGYVILIFIVAAVSILMSIMIPAAHDDIKSVPRDAAVVVPGCLIHGDKPGSTLKNRLDTALLYLKSHKNTTCVVTGGAIGKHTQASVMKNYLVEHGIDASHILVDDKSNTTYENMKNAKELLGGNKNIVITTDVYHEYRAKYYAKILGLRPFAVPSKTPPQHYIDSWMREFFAVVKAWIIKQ